MKIKKDSLCFANYILLSDESKTRKVGIFWVNDASEYNCVPGSFKFCSNLYKPELISIMTSDKKQQAGLNYRNKYIASTVYLFNILYLSEIINKMPDYLKERMNSKESLDDLDIMEISSFVLGNLKELGFEEQEPQKRIKLERVIDGRPVPLSYE